MQWSLSENARDKQKKKKVKRKSTKLRNSYVLTSKQNRHAQMQLLFMYERIRPPVRNAWTHIKRDQGQIQFVGATGTTKSQSTVMETGTAYREQAQRSILKTVPVSQDSK